MFKTKDRLIINMGVKKFSYLAIGWLSLGLGVIGIVLPLLPTTPFVLLSAFCFSKSSERFHTWLLTHRVFGPLVKDWENGGIIRLKAKLLATFSIIVMVSFSLYLIQPSIFVIITILTSISLVLAFIWSRPSEIK